MQMGVAYINFLLSPDISSDFSTEVPVDERYCREHAIKQAILSNRFSNQTKHIARKEAGKHACRMIKVVVELGTHVHIITT